MPDFRETLTAKFQNLFASKPIFVKAPGRINLIGEHTDYNDGFVLPASIHKAVYLAIAPNNTNVCHIHAMDLDDTHHFDLSAKLQPIDGHWVNYPMGVVGEMQKAGNKVGGFDACFASDIPIGSGLSSSAALESAFAFGINSLFDHDLSREQLARIGQKAEHNYAGVKCGIMDQFASCLGKSDHAFKLDCRNLQFEYVPAVFSEYELVLFDTKVKHNLASSEYNVRRIQCEEGVSALKEVNPEIKALRDATIEELELVRNQISNDVYKRSSYVIEENKRVTKAAEALRGAKVEDLGSLMFETHNGLSKLYEVSCSELDVLADIARNHQKIIGARMMGGGFGGCTINLIESGDIEVSIKEVLSSYKNETKKEAGVYRIKIDEGVNLLNW